MSKHDQEYLRLLGKILALGERVDDRTGTGTIRLFGEMVKYDCSQGFPLLTCKKMNWESIVGEIQWMLRGETNVNTLVTRSGRRLKFWDAWADPDGELGPTYGHQLHRNDQWNKMVAGLGSGSRRLLVNLWNVDDVDKCRLPPCHVLSQWSTRGEYVDCVMYQRSCDYFLGAPFNIAGYALLMHQLPGWKPGVLTIAYGDVHVYLNHVDLCVELLRRRVDIPAPSVQGWDAEGYAHDGELRGEISV